MQIIQSRRDFLASAVGRRRRERPWRADLARRRGAAGNDHDPASVKSSGSVSRPQYVAEELLRAEGFTDVRYV